MHFSSARRTFAAALLIVGLAASPYSRADDGRPDKDDPYYMTESYIDYGDSNDRASAAC